MTTSTKNRPQQTADQFRDTKHRTMCDGATEGLIRAAMALTATPEPLTPWTRPNASDLGKPSVTTGSDGHKAILRQWQRIAGIEGIANLTRARKDARGNVVGFHDPAASCKPTRSVPIDRAGLCPSAQVTVNPATTGGMFDVSKETRYASHYTGEQFSKSSLRRKAKIERLIFTSSYPYWPLDDKGAPRKGRYTPETGTYFKVGFDTIHLSDCIAQHQRLEESESRKARDRRNELEALMAEQAADARETRHGFKSLRA